MSAVTDASYVQSSALGMLTSLDHYGHTSPPVSDGRVATPAYYANRLGRVLHARGDVLPGDPTEWWGSRWGSYARQLLGTVPA